MWSNQAGIFFREYMGTGLIVILFLAALVYLFLQEKRKHIRLLFLYVPLCILLIFFNPVFSYFMQKFLDDEIYYRILWLLPVTVVTAYAAVSVCMRCQGKKRAFCALLAAAGFIVCGNCVYGNPLFSRAENMYHVPDSVAHICDAIEIEGREVTAVFPLDLVLYVRQYSPVVCMPYGREILVEKWSKWAVQSELCDQMESEEPDARLLGPLAREDACVYIVLPEEKKLRGDMQEQGYALFDRIDGYVIYKDMYFDPGI